MTPLCDRCARHETHDLRKCGEAIMYRALDPGIRQTVAWLRGHGFNTTDSGDGKAKFEEGRGFEGVLDFPHVFMKVTPPDQLLEQACRLRQLIVNDTPVYLEPGQIQATYDPVDGSAVLALYGIDDAQLKAVG